MAVQSEVFNEIDEKAAKEMEKVLAHSVKAGDCRFTGFGTDNRKDPAKADSKRVHDDLVIGPVAFVTRPHPKSTDPDVAGTGTITKMFYNCVNLKRTVMVSTGDQLIPKATEVAKEWVETSSISVSDLVAKCPSV